MGKGIQKVQTSSYKINKSWECGVQHGDYSYNIVYQKVAEKVPLKRYLHKKKKFQIMRDVTLTYCGDCFATCIYIYMSNHEYT